MSNFNQIAEFGKKLMTLEKIEDSLELIADEAKKLLNAQRCSIFMVDKEENILWTKLSDGIGRIVLSLDSGVIGHTYKTGKPQIVNSPYEDSRFLQKIDKESGFITKNIITAPIFNSNREIIGIVELLNKSMGDFNDKDLRTLAFLANYVSGSLELASINTN